MSEAVADPRQRAAEVTLLVMVGLAFVGAALIVAGVALLAGLAWALIASGAFVLAIAAVIRRGMFRAV